MVRHLTVSERRLREAEQRRVAAESARSKSREHDAAVEAAASARGARMDHAGRQTSGRGPVRDAAVVGHETANENAEERFGIQLLSPLPSSGTVSYGYGRTSRRVVDGEQSRDHVSGFAGEQQQHGDRAVLQENRNPSGSLTVGFGFPTSPDNEEESANILREVEAARRQVAVAEQQAATLRVDADRVKGEAAKTAAEAEIGKERAMMESERLAREIKETGIEVWGGDRFTVLSAGVSGGMLFNGVRSSRRLSLLFRRRARELVPLHGRRNFRCFQVK